MTVKIPVFCMPELPPESFRCLRCAKNRDATPATPPFRKNQTSRRQTADLMAEYPGCEAIAEIGSGLNFRRRRFLAMLERVIPYAVSKMYCGCPPRPAS
ncbi:MAG: hypothetical protein GDA56_24320 [Hormoscilla sp. GM7CHS1pb]|nr:hypothetical protein [Hormoscilla sp. GM7CHS1pb]